MTSSAVRRKRGFASLKVMTATAVLAALAVRAIPIFTSLTFRNRSKAMFDAMTSCVCRAVDNSARQDLAQWCYWDRRLRKQNGFTLVELMVTIAILAIVLTIATPSFTNIILNNRIDSIAHELHGSLQLARSEAVKRKGAVRVCRSNADMDDCAEGSDWSVGWLILSKDDEVLKVWQEVQGSSVTGPSEAVMFYGSGMTNTEEEFSVTASNCINNQKRSITLRRVGSSVLSRGHCDD